MKRQVPAISIIIPMYNVEKYVGECLDSILAQTFDDYEVIAVDDCSTDKTCEVVESYLPRFNGKLQLIRSKVNSGGAGTPRNTGLRLSRGQYIYLMDADDALIKTGLEGIYNAAEETRSDVIHGDKYFQADGESVSTDVDRLKIISKELVQEIKTPAALSKDLAVRIDRFISGKMRVEPWENLIRRDWLIKNEIKFSNLSIADDLVFAVMLLCAADNFVLYPNCFYVWRVREDSNSRETLSIPKIVHKKIGDIFGAVKVFENFLNKLKFFSDHPDYKYKIFDFITSHECNNSIVPVYAQIPAWQLDPLIRRELAELKDQTALTAFLFARMNVINVQLLQAQNLLRQQPKEVQDFQRNNEIIQRQQSQIQQLQQQLRNVHDIFR